MQLSAWGSGEGVVGVQVTVGCLMLSGDWNASTRGLNRAVRLANRALCLFRLAYFVLPEECSTGRPAATRAASRPPTSSTSELTNASNEG